CCCCVCFFFFSSRRRHTRFSRDWSSDVCSSDLRQLHAVGLEMVVPRDRRPEPDREVALGDTDRLALDIAEPVDAPALARDQRIRSEERRVGKEGRPRGWPCQDSNVNIASGSSEK